MMDDSLLWLNYNNATPMRARRGHVNDASGREGYPRVQLTPLPARPNKA